jgi:hypothetical protein
LTRQLFLSLNVRIVASWLQVGRRQTKGQEACLGFLTGCCEVEKNRSRKSHKGYVIDGTGNGFAFNNPLRGLYMIVVVRSKPSINNTHPCWQLANFNRVYTKLHHSAEHISEF